MNVFVVKACKYFSSGFPIGFFNPIIPTQNFVQSRNPEGYFWNPTFQAYFQSQISSRFSFQIPNPELLIGEIPSPEKPIDDPLSWQIISLTCTLCASYITAFVSVGLSLSYILPYPNPLFFFFFRCTELLSQTWVDGLQQESQTDQAANGESRGTLLIDLQAWLNWEILLRSGYCGRKCLPV